MGMFDWVKCEMPLPQTEVSPPHDILFQTKDTPDQGLTVYTITTDGRLSWKPYTYGVVPISERPYPDDSDWRSIIGSLHRIEKDPEVVSGFHGDVVFYYVSATMYWEYSARFTDGSCSHIELVEYRCDA